jgi:hypothetical protein
MTEEKNTGREFIMVLTQRCLELANRPVLGIAEVNETRLSEWTASYRLLFAV